MEDQQQQQQFSQKPNEQPQQHYQSFQGNPSAAALWSAGPRVFDMPMVRPPQVLEPLNKRQRSSLMSWHFLQTATAVESYSQQMKKQLLEAQLQNVSMKTQPVRSASGSVYVPGMCAQRLANYTLQMQQRPEDNNLEFWRNFIAEFFVPGAKKRWCFSSYGKKPDGVIYQEAWHCGICKEKAGSGFEIIIELLPRLCKIKYDTGTIKEHYHLEMPVEYKTESDLIVLQCAKVTYEIVYQYLRVIREGQLCVVFTPDLKIFSWEFCAKRHDELIPMRVLNPLLSDLRVTAKEYRDAKKDQNWPAQGPETNSFDKTANSANQLTNALKPVVNELGYEKKYARSLQISEVLRDMKDLMRYSRITGTAPKESLVKFSSTFNMLSGRHSSYQQPEKQQQQPQIQPFAQDISNGRNKAEAAPLHLSAQPSKCYPMMPSSSKVHHQMDCSSLGGASSLASAAARLHINSSNSSMHLNLYDHSVTSVEIHEQSMQNPQLGGDAGLEGVGIAEHNSRGGASSSGLMDMSSKPENTRINVDEDDFEKQLLFFIEGENASRNSYSN